MLKLFCMPMLMKPMMKTLMLRSQNEPVFMKRPALMPVTAAAVAALASVAPRGSMPLSFGLSRTRKSEVGMSSTAEIMPRTM